MTFLKKTIFYSLLIFSSLHSRQMGTTQPRVPAQKPATQLPRQPVTPIQQIPQKPITSPKTFDDYITHIRTQWKHNDVINAQGIFTDTFIDFVLLAHLDELFTRTLLEVGRNLYLPLSANNAENMQKIFAANEAIERIMLAHDKPFYDPKTKIFRQSYLDELVAKLDPMVTSKATITTFTNNTLASLEELWNLTGESNTTLLLPQARQQINTAFEKYGFIKPVVHPVVPDTKKPQPKPQPSPIAPQQPIVKPTQSPSSISLKIGTTLITIVKGDLLKQQVDAIVNAANEDLDHAGGVALAISRAAGPQLQAYCDTMPLRMPIVDPSSPQNVKQVKCPTGQAVITPAFDLEQKGIKNIIHTAGPFGNNPNREKLLASSYKNSLQVALDNNLKSIAFPAISTAIFRYNIDQATPIAFAAIRDFVKQHPHAFDEIRLVLLPDKIDPDKNFNIYKKWMGELTK